MPNDVNPDVIKQIGTDAPLASIQQQTEGIKPVDVILSLPSKRLTLTVTGRDYLNYVQTAERIITKEKLSTRQKDERVVELALKVLASQIQQIEEKTGKVFVTEEDLL